MLKYPPSCWMVGLLVLCFHSMLVVAAECTATQCGECTKTAGCGWCSATQTCHEGNNTGPATSVCLGSWRTTCPVCSNQFTCIGCAANLDCEWCVGHNGTTQCLARTADNQCASKVNTCPCNEYNTCHECAGVPGCTFCDTGSCSDSALGCTKVSCSCENYPTCTTCNDDPACGWCGGLSSCKSLPAECYLVSSCDIHCNVELSCLDCTAERGCGWCPTRDVCHSIDSTICGTSLQTQCPKYCEKVTDCNLCVDMGLPCAWCPHTKSCIDSSVIFNCSTSDSCAAEVCPQAEDCGGCLQTPGCGWCNSRDLCVDILNTEGCNLARSCTDDFQHRFSVGSFFGGMAAMLALYMVIGVAAFVYKKRVPPHVYEQVN